eukprot:9120395-Ditylum_brightwellii.AAC.1
MAMGISRDDLGAFIPNYMEQGIWSNDSFSKIDVEGVGCLLQKMAEAGICANPKLSLSIFGGHGGDPESIQFFNKVGLNYVSCSSFHVPIAHLACGQVAAKHYVEDHH